MFICENNPNPQRKGFTYQKHALTELITWSHCICATPNKILWFKTKYLKPFRCKSDGAFQVLWFRFI